MPDTEVMTSQGEDFDLTSFTLVAAPRLYADAVMVTSNGQMVCFTFGVSRSPVGGDPNSVDVQATVFMTLDMALSVHAKLDNMFETMVKARESKPKRKREPKNV